METLHFETTINAPIAKVWDTMLNDATYRVWTLEFNEGGSWFEGSWESGSKIKFFGPDPKTGDVGGMTSEIAENRPHEYISIRHLGFIQNGVEVFDTPEVKAWMPSYENYAFKSVDEHTTHITVELTVPNDFKDMFNEMWPRALTKLKEMCEESS
jgi:uncharacterized protein YndB with AHSA1/START domain